jgi:stress response protein YsnF
MAKTVVGLMDNISEAQDVVRDLVDSGFNRDAISILTRRDERTEGMVREEEGTTDTGSGAAKGAGAGAVLGGIVGLVVGIIPGVGPILAAGPIAATLVGAGVGAVAGGIVGALTNMGVPEEHANYYAEGVRRGGVLVTVATADENADQAADIMRRHGAVDIEKRAEHWRSTGWERFDEKAAPYSSEEFARERESIPVVKEDVHIGKREVPAGGVHVYSHLAEEPVEEQVKLREEHAKVQRRKVDRPASEADISASRDASFEIRETAEEPVVSKEARVIEEVSMGRETSERTETVRDTERHTEVEVERAGAGRTGTVETREITDFVAQHSTDARYEDKDWAAVEPDLRREWEAHHPGTWNSRREAIRDEWDRSRAKSRVTV